MCPNCHKSPAPVRHSSAPTAREKTFPFAKSRFKLRPAMYIAITRDIQVTALPDFLPDRSDPDQGRFFWSYTIEIANLGRTRVQLLSRHWIIIDANGRREEVRGPGVIGEQPVLEPGETFRYASGCPLTTPSGLMQGSYRMVTDSGETFDVEIPAFSLDSPMSNPTLN